LHSIVVAHILWEYGLLAYGLVAIASTNYSLCSALLPERVALMLSFHHGGVLALRVAHHVAFPAYVTYFSRMNPLPAMDEVARASDPDKAVNGGVDDESVAERLEKVRRTVDHNFHAIQRAWTYRSKLPNLVDPLKKSQVAPASPATSIVVRPRSTPSKPASPLPKKA